MHAKWQIKICSFGILTDKNLKIKIYILGYLTGIASQIFQNEYFYFRVLENKNMHFVIFDWHWLVKYSKIHILIFEFWSVKNPILQTSIFSLMYPKRHILIFEFWKIRIYILGYLTSADWSNILKCMFWFVEFWSVKNPKLQILICSLKFFNNLNKELVGET